MAKLSASRLAIQDYLQRVKPDEDKPELLNLGSNPEQETARAAYKSYLTTPTPEPKVGAEGVTSETISNVKEAYKKGGLLPAVLQGLGGLIKLANTSAGQNIIAGLSAPTQTTVTGARGVKQTVAAPFSSMAWLQQAGKTGEQEQGLKQGAITQELERIKQLGGYNIEEMKQEIESNRIAEEQKFREQQAEEERIWKEQREAMQSFEDKRKDIYEANKNLPGAEDILKATNEQELNNIADRIVKGRKYPIVGTLGGKIKKEKKPLGDVPIQ